MSGAVEGVALSLADQAREVLATVLERHQLNSSAYYVRDSQGIKLTAVIAMEAMLEFASRTTPPARSYADGVEDAARIVSQKAQAISTKLGRGKVLDEVTLGIIAILTDAAADIRLLSQEPQP